MHSFVFTAYLFVKKRDNSFGISMKNHYLCNGLIYQITYLNFGVRQLSVKIVAFFLLNKG